MRRVMRAKLNRIQKDMSFGVFAFIRDAQKRVLMVRHNYGQRKWSLPGGGLEQGELATRGVQREVAEETGYVVGINGLIGIYSLRKSPGIVLLYSGKVLVSDPVNQLNTQEISQARFISLEELRSMKHQIYPAQLGLIERATTIRKGEWPESNWLIPPEV